MRNFLVHTSGSLHLRGASSLSCPKTEQGRVAIVNFLELLRSTLDTLKHPGLSDSLA